VVAALSDVPVETIRVEAASIRPRATALAAVAWPLYWLGFLSAKLMTVVIWRSARFVVASVRVGWREAAGPSKRVRLEKQRAEIADLRMQLSRFTG